MAYIKVEGGVPGIRSLVLFRPETGKPLYELVQVLLRGESILTEAERELIAAYVSYLNQCMFCMNSHAAAARCLYGDESMIVDEVLHDMWQSAVSDKMKSLLHIAGKVQILGKEASNADIQAAKDLGADDKTIHDTVLIAAAFCMFNRYVDGLASFTPTDPSVYEEMGKRMAKGYVLPTSIKNNMAYIQLPAELPGIRGPMAFRPETAKPMNELAEILLRDDNNTLSRGERELIGAYVSYLNDCFFCQNVHGALAQHYMQCDMEWIDAVKKNMASSSLSDKMKALLSIASSVQKGGRHVTSEQIEHAKTTGATDKELHDTVLIAAAFCMFNRYVDGLNTWAPTDRQVYIQRAKMRAEEGYLDFDLYK